MAEALITCQVDGAIATVTLNRPQKLNTLTTGMLDTLETMARHLNGQSEIRVVILTATGDRAFCAGADINEWSSLPALDMWRIWVRRGHQVFDQWAQLRQPVIVAINAHALGGGLELAITGDIRIASDKAKFALPEASISTCPGWSGTQRLVRIMGAGTAKYLALSGEQMDAQTALRTGLIHEIVTTGSVFDRARELAQQMCCKAPVALQLCKQLINAASGEAADVTLESMASALAALTKDAQEGLLSFREKRPAIFTGC